MFTEIELKNFRCIEYGKINFSKITLLTGANNSGKSSLINALLGCLQASDFPFSFAPNGANVSLGDFGDIIHRHNQDTSFELNIKVSTPDAGEIQYKTSWVCEKKTGMPQLSHCKTTSDSFKFSADWDGDFYDIELVTKKKKKSASLEEKEDAFNQLLAEFEKFFKLDEDGGEGTTIKYKTGDKASLRLKNLSKLNGALLSKYGSSLNVIEPLRLVSNTFSSLNGGIAFISPFRHHPERTYYQKGDQAKRIDKFGDGYVDQILNWQYNAHVKFKLLKNKLNKVGIINSLKVSKLSGGRYQLSIRTTGNKSYVNLVDTGFGVSQFLPVIVADIQLPKKSLLILAEPEIHLHPNAQAKFGDYLVDAIKSSSKNYLIETHSEYLLNRLRLKIVRGDLSPSDVAIYHFEKVGETSVIHKLVFESNGTITGAPKDFFETYLMDTMNIALEAK